MKYDNPRLKQMLAAEYVLGTLRGGARKRFERLLQTRADLLRERQLWETRLAVLLAGTKPVVPRDIVWTGIEHRIGAAAATPLKLAPSRRSLRIWQTWAVAASVAVAVLSVQLLRREAAPPAVPPPPAAVGERPPYVSMLQVSGSEAVWLISLNPQKGLIRVTAHGDYALDAKRESLELWIIGDDGQPHALGLLPTRGRGSMPMPGGLSMPAKPQLAVSREPLGGSPTGLPTGPVITSGPVVSL